MKTLGRRCCSRTRRRHAGVLLCLCLAWVLVESKVPGMAAANSSEKAPSRTIGIEGGFWLELPRPDYRPRPLDDRTEMILRIDAVTPTNGQYRYDFYYMGLEPGAYKLADYLIRPDGTRPDELAQIPLHVRSLLPEDHNGHLNPVKPNRFPFIGGYRVFLGAIGLAWAGGIAAFVISYRKKKVVAGPVAVEAPPSLADLMRPLVEAAAAGRLSLDGQAQLERLLMGYWRERLDLPVDLRMAEAITRLKEHPQAGELLRALERWLHRPGGISAAEIHGLLEPYRTVATSVADNPETSRRPA